MEHELALDKLKALVMKKWHLGDPLPVLYMDETAKYPIDQIMPMYRKGKTASLVMTKEDDGYRVAKNRWTERPMGLLTYKDYAFFRAYTREETR